MSGEQPLSESQYVYYSLSNWDAHPSKAECVGHQSGTTQQPKRMEVSPEIISEL